MKPKEVLGLLLGVSGIVVTDLGFAGSKVTDLFYVENPIPSMSSTTGSNLVGNLLPPGGNTPLIFVGAGLLALGMISLILHARSLIKSSSSAASSKKLA